jgi:CRISPR-associated endoribonuclease Cas6
LRFSVTYDINGIPELPIDYRAGFVALIKTARDKQISEIKYKSPENNNKKYNPFCFAIRFDKKPTIKQKKINIGKKIKLYISSASQTEGSSLYNGFLSIKEFSLYGMIITSPLISYIKEHSILQNEVTFVTLSPIIIRHYQKKDRYVLPNEEGFNESFLNAIKEQLSSCNDNYVDLCHTIKFKILKYKKVVMTHYGGLVLGFTGILQIFANSITLKTFYQCGIGYRRAHGFGLLSVYPQ